MRTQLNNAGLTGTAIAASDENNTKLAVSTWNSFSSVTQSQVGWVQTHGYSFNATAATQLYNASQGKQLWMSEYGDNDSERVDDGRGNRPVFQFPAQYRLVLLAADRRRQLGTDQRRREHGTMSSVNPKYYVFAQYSRSIRQGMTILSSGDPNTVAAYDPVNHDLVFVTLNSGAGTETVTYNLGNFSSVGSSYTGWCTDTNGSVLYQPISGTVSGGSVSLSFASSSVQTLVIPNVYFAACRPPRGPPRPAARPTGPPPRTGRPAPFPAT